MTNTTENPNHSEDILHELKVHQMELEMQNEELRSIQLELDRTKSKYFDLYELAPIGYLVLSKGGRINEANLYMTELLGDVRQNIISRKFEQYVYEEDQQLYYAFSKELAEGVVPKTCEVRMVRKNGDVFWAQIEASSSLDKELLTTHCIISDITKRKKAEHDQAESETKYRLMYEHMDQGMALLKMTQDGQNRENNYIILEVNHYFEGLLGISGERSVGKRLADVIGESQDYWSELLESVDRTGQPVYDEKRLAITGRHYALSCYKTVGNQFVLLMRDITERIEKEQEIHLANTRLEELVAIRTKDLNIYLQAVEQSPASVIITDIQGKILYVNAYLIKVSGYSFDELLGKNTSILQSGATPELVYQKIWDQITHGQIWRGELLNKKKSGELYWEDVSISPIIDEQGRTISYLSVKEDITQNKKMMVELELEKQKAEEATKAKSEFLANMSHEIRTPMNAVIGLSELALKTELDDKQADYIHKINSAGVGLLGIINDILDFSKIEAGMLIIEEKPFFINDVVANLLGIFSFRAENLGINIIINLHSDVPTILMGDGLRLGQILINLMNNALKFSPSGDVILSIKCLKCSSDKVTIEFSITDSGEGIDESKRDMLFSAFVQGDTSTTREYGGTGLGLAICKELVEIMGGVIDYTSIQGVGTRFFFQLPFKVCLDSECDQDKLINEGYDLLDDDIITDMKDVRILVVEDNEINQEILKELLLRKGCLVDIARNGQEAIDRIMSQKESYHLVLMDLQMPVMDGYKATEMIRQHYNMVKLPIIAITAEAMVGSEIKVIASGMNDYLTKPINHRMLYRCVSKWITNKD